MINQFKRLIFHPFLFAIYPPLFLLVYNLQQLKLVSTVRAFLISLILATIIFFVLKLITKNAQRAGLLTTAFYILFFSYGPVHSLIPDIQVFGSSLTNQRYMLILWGLVSVLVIWWLGWKLRNTADLNGFMNLAGFVLIGVVLIQGVLSTKQLTSKQLADLHVQTVTTQLNPPPVDQRPDIYYIILDAYSSSEVLKDDYNIDNQDFISRLEQRGFYVANCAHSNYPITAYSLASSLNMDYIPPVGEQLLPNLTSSREFIPYMGFNSVRYTLKDLGYSTVTFDTYYAWTNVTNVDVFISPRGKSSITFKQILDVLIGGTNEYEQMLLDMTPLVRRAEILNFLHITPAESTSASTDTSGSDKGVTNNVGEQKLVYDVYKYSMDQLVTVPSIPGKKFVFAHFISTHPPFLFSEDGTFKLDQTINGYASAIRYTDKVILDAVDQIIAQSNPKPVIIIQGDHALQGSKEAFGILNAYYLPGINPDILYPSISPVNSFRIIFNEYFGANFPLLADKSYLIQEHDGKLIPDLQETNPNCK